jgi:hypothetical protein
MASLEQSGQESKPFYYQCYASHTWEFLDGIDSHICLEPKTWMHPQRTGDSLFIMDNVVNVPGIKRLN